MGPERQPIQVLLGWIEGKRLRGRSRKTKIHAGLDDLGLISGYHGTRGFFLEWQNLAQGRQEWRDVVSRLVDAHA